VDVALFASQVSEDGYLRHSDYNTQTVNLNFRFKLGDKDNFYVKAVTNALNANVPTRLTLAQFNADSRQAGGTGPGNESALSRRRASGERTSRDFLAVRDRLHKDRAYWELVEAGEHVLRQAEDLVQKADVRTLDALHLASAVVFQSETGLSIPFITSDARQCDAAHAIGLTTIWVE
jgi:predicted nucleic acid-binding protein